MPGIEKGLAYIGIWLACTSIVLDATNPHNGVSEFSAHNQNNSGTRAQGSFVSILHHLGSGNSSGSQGQHRCVGIHLGSGDIIQQSGSIEKEKETDLMEISRGGRKIEDQGNQVAAVIDGFKVESSNYINRLQELTNGSIATTQELRSSFDQMAARIASIDRSLAGMAELTNKTLARSEQMLSAYNSTRIQLDETKSSLCPYSRGGSSTSDSKLLPDNCWEIYQSGCYESGIYKIRPRTPSVDSSSVYCEMDSRGGGWTVLQNRVDGSLNFYQTWSRYKDGFGNLDGEFWLGLDLVNQLTNSKRYELLIELEDFDGQSRFAVYDNFVVSSEEDQYSMQKLGSYTGNAGDSLSPNVGWKFSTYDQDNDSRDTRSCADWYGGGWWFENCAKCMLNGFYTEGVTTQTTDHAGVIWEAWRGENYSYKKSRMSIRPVNR